MPLPTVLGRPPVAETLDPYRVTALIPCHREPPCESLVEQVRAVVGGVLLVDDGTPPASASTLEILADAQGVELLRLPVNVGKGHAIAAGLRHLLSRRPSPEAVLVLDADGQHPPEAIRAFLAAGAEAELVIGDRFGALGPMPWQRRLANRLATRLLALTSRRAVRDSQCGMRLLRSRALHEVAFPGGRYESETRHLKRCLRSGVGVTWVPIPALYNGEPSSFRPLRDGLRVLVALLGP